MRLEPGFYERNNVVKIARELLGKALFTQVKGVISGGIIVETEAYSWKERGCHAFGGKMTPRNEVMFLSGGHAYVYLCYGIHNLFNVVTNVVGLADAVLIRAIEPLQGIGVMKERRDKVESPFQLTSGPGKLTKALGIDRSFNGKFLLNSEVWIEDVGEKLGSKQIEAGKRIGIDYAGKDAKLPWRFVVKGNSWVSK
jgi:DNA-3-methyladenine glycosylase